jgi:GTPase SAR1 family protein
VYSNRPYFKTQMKKCQFSIVGRDELKRKRFFVVRLILSTLCNINNCQVLIGPSKSGKTSVVRRLVDKAYQGYVGMS